jgi:uncharacterized membrane protein
MATGFPTVLGWEGHQHQWRGTTEYSDPRRPDVERMYKTHDEAELRELLAKYDVRYVIVGDAERGKYRMTDGDVRRLSSWLTPVFESGNTIILERR